MPRHTITLLLVYLLQCAATADDASLTQRHESALDSANALLETFHKLSESETPDEMDLRVAEKKALAALTEAMKLEFELRAQRIDSARRRLDALQQKLSQSRAAIGTLAEERMTMRLAELSEANAARFTTPREVIDEMESRIAAADFEGFVDLLTDDAIEDFAAGLLISTASLSIVEQMAQSTGIPEAESQFAQTKGIEKLLKNSLHPEPSGEALAAYTATMSYFANQLFQPKPDLSGSPSLQQIRKATGMLENPRTFIVEALKAMNAMEGSVKLIERADGGNIRWLITENGDRAVAIPDEARAQGMLEAKIELRQIGGSWKISSLISDEALHEIAKGPRVGLAVAESAPATLPPTAPTPVYSPVPSPYANPQSAPTPHDQPVPSLSNPNAPGSPAPSPDLTYYYSGRDIAWWLDHYWNNDSRVNKDEALAALKVLREQESSDAHILRRFLIWYQSVHRELNQERLIGVVDSIVEVAGVRHQEKAIDYLFQIADRFVLNNESAEEFAMSHRELFTTLSKIKRWDEQLATQVANALSTGSSNQRLLALMMLLNHFEDSEQYRMHQDRLANWFGANQKSLAAGVFAASEDKLPMIRETALSVAAILMPRSGTLAARLTEAIASDSSPRVRRSSLESLIRLQPDHGVAHTTILSMARSENQQDVKFVLSLFQSGAYDFQREQFVDEMMELLGEPDWGLGQKMTFPDSNGQMLFPRQQLLSVIGDYSRHAQRAAATLKQEVELKNPDTQEYARRAIDQIVGFTESLPVASLQGDWVVESFERAFGDQFLIPMSKKRTKGGRHMLTVSETSVMTDGDVVARLSGAEGQNPNVLRFTANRNGHRVDCSGDCTFSGENEATVRLRLIVRSLPNNRHGPTQEFLLRRPLAVEIPESDSVESSK